MTDIPSRLDAARAALDAFHQAPRSMTLAGGVRLDDVRALATTDEEPFLLMSPRRKRRARIWFKLAAAIEARLEESSE
jgi:hypothetical protein